MHNRQSETGPQEHPVSDGTSNPATTQGFGCVLMFDAQSQTPLCISANAPGFFDKPAKALLCATADEIFDTTVFEALRAARSKLGALDRVRVGRFVVNKKVCDLYLFATFDGYGVEVEKMSGLAQFKTDSMGMLTSAIQQIQKSQSEAELLGKTVELLAHLTGYERVMALEFDAEFNGHVVAESVSESIDSYFGLHFSGADLPAGDRDMMMKTPLRMIPDVNDTSAPLLWRDGPAQTADLTHALVRGVTGNYLRYLRSMDVGSALTLSVVIDGKLWGVIAFQSRYKRTIADEMRLVLLSFVTIFADHVKSVRQVAKLQRAEDLDAIRANIEEQVENDQSLDQSWSSFAPFLTEVFCADGIALVTSDSVSQSGCVPTPEHMKRMLDQVRKSGQDVFVSDALSRDLPEGARDMGDPAGCLVASFKDDRAVLLFRNEHVRRQTWIGCEAGVIGRKTETLRQHCAPWSARDIWLANRLWNVLVAADRRYLINTINRQQALMINELNHRVRNILSLIRSVSRQTRPHYTSLDSYSDALEARIQALAAAHDLSTGASVVTVPVRKILQVETSPYRSERAERFVFKGENLSLKADYAPLLALVIHELVTNCSKYGAFSEPCGQVSVTLLRSGEGFALRWVESGGPLVKAPKAFGFGQTLIEEAVPYELGGRAEISYPRGGVRAELWLPDHLFDPASVTKHVPGPDVIPAKNVRFRQPLTSGYVLVLEDNFVTAKDMQSSLGTLGFANCKLVSNLPDAFKHVAGRSPSLAVLDINLGGDTTSFPLADYLIKLGIPVVFASGYGDQIELPGGLRNVPVLTKPVRLSDLSDSVSAVLDGCAPNQPHPVLHQPAASAAGVS